MSHVPTASAQQIVINGQTIDRIVQLFSDDAYPTRRPGFSTNLPCPDGFSRRNPVIDQRSRTDGLVFDARAGRWVLAQSCDTVHRSALDPHRNHVDPGSLRTRTTIGRDARGNQIQTTVTSWTSFGRPHSTTQTRILRRSANGTVIDQQNMFRSAGPRD